MIALELLTATIHVTKLDLATLRLGDSVYCFKKTLKALDTRVANVFFSNPRWASSAAGTDGFFRSGCVCVFVGLGWGVASGNKLGTRLLEGASAMYPEKGAGMSGCIAVSILRILYCLAN